MALTPAQKQKQYRERLKAKAAGSLPNAPAPANIPPTKRWRAMQARASELLEQLQAELQSYFDERSEEWQESERAEAMQTQIEAVESALESLQEVEL